MLQSQALTPSMTLIYKDDLLAQIEPITLWGNNGQIYLVLLGVDSVGLERMTGPISVVCLLLVKGSFITGFASVAALLWTHKTISWNILQECSGHILKNQVSNLVVVGYYNQVSPEPQKLATPALNCLCPQSCFTHVSDQSFFSFPKERKKLGQPRSKEEE